ncbi:hypothetical protein CFC21_030606 [Triticum aestivum]|uniref:Uncharacterized protein n=4 Tax=Triticum TaxID=4564 RepID=A0A9R1E2P1_WHEAT|nr:hypothetical protein TRIUR3_03273 [Triticum urartu]KAF7002355.1 hypothetical protein CFC21_017856 [Triticum aestivum]KAF7002357.1 hypothetical protein CFC21_017858 [Triticum aestivum]KAF7017121.1 hypothetical protein CFC21_030606 [Triticum aestivum]VAH33689.1 unnamed protein product [Triticum turgidum subsp. durum]
MPGEKKAMYRASPPTANHPSTPWQEPLNRLPQRLDDDCSMKAVARMTRESTTPARLVRARRRRPQRSMR